jgi:thiosulfate/3-mercaptopyruvate sulfurtransferase
MSSSSRAQYFVSAAELAELLSSSTPPVVLDVRNQNGVPDGRPEYEAGHVPGAFYVDLPRELVGPADVRKGAGPLPRITDLEASARSWGIDNGDAVVVYDNVFGTKAGRAWFVLRWAGIESVRLLDGGYAAWVSAGCPISTVEPAPGGGNVDLTEGNLPVLEADDAAEIVATGILLDARGYAQYVGKPAEGGRRTGHIPGAMSAPTGQNLSGDGLLLDEDQLLGRLAALGIDGSRPVGLYCGSGVAAAHELAVLLSVGVPGRLYVGSFSEWSADPERPVAIGPDGPDRPNNY